MHKSGSLLPQPGVRSPGFRFDDRDIMIHGLLRSSRVSDWQFDLAVSTRADRIKKISDLLEARALISINVGELAGVGEGKLGAKGTLGAFGRLFAGLASIKDVKFGLPFHTSSSSTSG